MGAREEITRAILDGDRAARNGDPPSVCPHPRTSVLRAAWIRGYAAARPVTEPDE
ncbi:Rmf/CrpP fold protein [Streptomyces sp. NRRL F-5727]|uniref:Rmf/CrpP fold protein n=1 Tax=Streptomyces sp. NRRL F-5727 TaxID=1463871 RepID=UPI000AFF3181|nr:Rmf/CrpP fold protein [Streptomyces sp. NRRL F-5727]